MQIASQVEQELQRDDVTQEPVDDDDDDDVIMTEEEVGIKCPYTQQVSQQNLHNGVVIVVKDFRLWTKNLESVSCDKPVRLW